jgi:hypothetical protein
MSKTHFAPARPGAAPGHFAPVVCSPRKIQGYHRVTDGLSQVTCKKCAGKVLAEVLRRAS